MTGDIPGTADDPQAADWGGLSWSGWHGFDEAHRSNLIPATPGIYRFRARDEPGLLYIGESGARRGRRGRRAALARGRKRHPASFYLNWRTADLTKRPQRGHYAAPHIRRCEDVGSRRGLVGTGRTPGED